jgi:hypothetical protein
MSKFDEYAQQVVKMYRAWLAERQDIAVVVKTEKTSITPGAKEPLKSKSNRVAPVMRTKEHPLRFANGEEIIYEDILNPSKFNCARGEHDAEMRPTYSIRGSKRYINGFNRTCKHCGVTERLKEGPKRGVYVWKPHTEKHD